MNELVNKVKDWGHKKNLIKKENQYKQFAKVVEEVSEIGTALNNKNEEELIDAIGDATVTLIILSEQSGLEFEACLKTAYNIIKDRTGKTVNGVFIKN